MAAIDDLFKESGLTENERIEYGWSDCHDHAHGKRLRCIILRLAKSLIEMKASRIYFQDQVYHACNTFDRILGGTTIVGGHQMPEEADFKRRCDELERRVAEANNALFHAKVGLELAVSGPRTGRSGNACRCAGAFECSVHKAMRHVDAFLASTAPTR